MSVAAVLLVALLAAGCASLPGAESLPVMGAGNLKEAAAADSAAARPQADTTGAEQPMAGDTGELAEAKPDSGQALSQSLLFLPFRDKSEYDGPWNLPVAVPLTLGAELQSNDFLRPIPVNSVLMRLTGKEREGWIPLERGLELAKDVGADYIVFGQIDNLSMRRFRATVPAGGYRSYEGNTRITLRPIKVIDQEPLGDISREETEETQQYGITNPAAYVPYEKEYMQLGEIEWDSEEFHQTLVGQSVDKCVASLCAALDSLIRPPQELQALEPMVIDLDGEQAYINVGLADSVRNGDKYGVWDKGRVLTDPKTGTVLGRALPRRVGVVQVEQVLSEHLSMVRILEGQDDVRPEYGIRSE